jgi:hypothetical protein
MTNEVPYRYGIFWFVGQIGKVSFPDPHPVYIIPAGTRPNVSNVTPKDCPTLTSDWVDIAGTWTEMTEIEVKANFPEAWAIFDKFNYWGCR